MTIQTTFAHGINQFTGLGVLPTTQPKTHHANTRQTRQVQTH